jgi:hypothetical protein
MPEKTPEQIVEIANALEDLSKHPAWPLLEGIIRNSIEVKKDKIATNKNLSLEDYRYEQGFIKGLLAPFRAIEQAKRDKQGVLHLFDEERPS